MHFVSILPEACKPRQSDCKQQAESHRLVVKNVYVLIQGQLWQAVQQHTGQTEPLLA